MRIAVGIARFYAFGFRNQYASFRAQCGADLLTARHIACLQLDHLANLSLFRMVFLIDREAIELAGDINVGVGASCEPLDHVILTSNLVEQPTVRYNYTFDRKTMPWAGVY